MPASTVPVNLPGAGTYDIVVPSAFKFTATKQGDVTMLADVPCALKAGAPSSLGSIILAANESTTKATPAKKVTPLGKQTKLKVVVEAANEVPTGKVKVMKGEKVLGKGTLNAKGKVKVTLKKTLPAGQDHGQGEVPRGRLHREVQGQEGRDQGRLTRPRDSYARSVPRHRPGVRRLVPVRREWP